MALSAYSGERHQRLAREAGFDRTLTKPADPTELKRLLTMLAQALKLAERTETLAQQNVELARETKDLLTECWSSRLQRPDPDDSQSLL